MGKFIQSAVDFGRDVSKWWIPGRFNVEFGKLLLSVITGACKEGLRCMSRRRHGIVSVMSEVVSLGVWMNLNPRPSTRQISWGTVWCLVRLWNVRLGICERGLGKLEEM